MYKNVEFSIFCLKYIDIGTHFNLQNNALKLMSFFDSFYAYVFFFDRKSLNQKLELG